MDSNQNRPRGKPRKKINGVYGGRPEDDGSQEQKMLEIEGNDLEELRRPKPIYNQQNG